MSGFEWRRKGRVVGKGRIWEEERSEIDIERSVGVSKNTQQGLGDMPLRSFSKKENKGGR